jgi:hypothetical protein
LWVTLMTSAVADPQRFQMAQDTASTLHTDYQSRCPKALLKTKGLLQ